MKKYFFALSLFASPFLVHCSEEDSSSNANTAAGGAQGNGGSQSAGSSGAGASGAAGSSGDAGSGGLSGAGGSSGGASGSGTGEAGQGATAGEGGTGGECTPVASDGECAACMREECCEAWQECESDSACDACAQCLDEDGSTIATCLSSLDCGEFLNQPVTNAMVQCACGGDFADCMGPCAAPCVTGG